MIIVDRGDLQLAAERLHAAGFQLENGGGAAGMSRANVLASSSGICSMSNDDLRARTFSTASAIT